MEGFRLRRQGFQAAEMDVHRFMQPTAYRQIGPDALQGEMKLTLPQAMKLRQIHHHITQLADHTQTHLMLALHGFADGTDSARLQLVSKDGLHRALISLFRVRMLT